MSHEKQKPQVGRVAMIELFRCYVENETEFEIPEGCWFDVSGFKISHTATEIEFDEGGSMTFAEMTDYYIRED